MCLPGNATGGRDICVTLCLQRGGGGVGGLTQKNFSKCCYFLAFCTALVKTPKNNNISKKFFVSPPPPPPDANTGLHKCPPVACPGRHYTNSVQTHWFYHRNHHRLFTYHTTTLVLSLQCSSTFCVTYNNNFFITAIFINFLRTMQPHWFYHCNQHQNIEYHANTLVLSLQRSSIFGVPINHTGSITATFIDIGVPNNHTSFVTATVIDF